MKNNLIPVTALVKEKTPKQQNRLSRYLPLTKYRYHSLSSSALNRHNEADVNDCEHAHAHI